MDENLTKLSDDMSFVLSELQDALHNSTAVESIIVLELIQQAVKLQQGISQLHNAINSK